MSYQGDSGGPLTYKQSNGQHILIGEVSYGNSCALVGTCVSVVSNSVDNVYILLGRVLRSLRQNFLLQNLDRGQDVQSQILPKWSKCCLSFIINLDIVLSILTKITSPFPRYLQHNTLCITVSCNLSGVSPGGSIQSVDIIGVRGSHSR